MPTRLIASLAVALVIVLTVLAASPELHERLHGHDMPASGAHHDGQTGPTRSGGDDDGCVVTLFAQGLVICLAVVALAFTGQMLRLVDFPLFDRIAAESPRYLRLPTQAPPLGLI